ncbi:TetR/AcrR family transcriptional regulator [Saccharopolyspora sp. CA-218241]|uniref:TetR/AcrR family transcriptional regulator n=1 Tax=Saccharopolyspora sp. CA-218241 TaxID=3240027 RepID=UPI003D97DF9F
MRSDNKPTGQDGQATRRRTFTENARRAQIIECAIEVVCELGYGGASLSRIAEQAGVSKGVVLYHFAGKAELIEEIVRDVFARGEHYAHREWFDHLDDDAGAWVLLRTYLQSHLGYIAGHPHELQAVVEIIRSYRDDEGRRVFDAAWAAQMLAPLESICRQGQEAGEFRSFDPHVMAISVRRAIDGFMYELLAHPELDTTAYIAEVIDLFDHATRAEDTR